MEYVSVRGVEIPALGLGTWPMKGAECKRAVKTGLELGYRHVDTAQMYDNERAVGAAVRESDVDREDVFLTTKLLRENLGHEDVLASFRGCLTRLDTEYVDLLLIHAPSSTVPIEETMGGDEPATGRRGRPPRRREQLLGSRSCGPQSTPPKPRYSPTR